MKLLVDANLTPAWVAFLQGQGIEAVHWTTVGDVNSAVKRSKTFSHTTTFSADRLVLSR